MLNYIIKRLIASIITLWVIATLTFFMMHAIPGGPFTSDKNVPPQILANMEAKYGLNKPVSQQYVMYIENLLHGNLGPSIKYEGMTVNQVISQSFPASAKIGGLATVVAVLIGIWMGVVAALKQGKWQDQVMMVISLLTYTIPSFVLATLLIYVFAVKLAWLPAVGFDGPANMVMPVISLAAFYIAIVARLTRSTMLDVIRQDYIRTAKAKGLSKNVIIYKHALRNALIPVITFIGPLVAGIITGSFVVETIFGIPGMGREFVTSITNRDYMLIMGVTIFSALLLVVTNFLVDLLYAVIDPRIKLEG